VPLPDGSKNIEQFGRPVTGSIPTIIRSYKSAVSLRIHHLRGTPGSPVWQRNFYERVVRDEDELRQIAEYILNNPLGWETDGENPHRCAR
jgi:putative transposase